MSIYDFANVMKNAGKIKEELAKLQEKLADITVTGSSGGGMVEVVANGKMQILEIKIDDEVLHDDDKEMLNDLIVSAINQALQRAQQVSTEKMNELSGGLLSFLPEGFKFPGMA